MWLKDINGSYINTNCIEIFEISECVTDDSGRKSCAVRACNSTTECWYFYLAPYDNDVEKLNAVAACRKVLDDIIETLMYWKTSEDARRCIVNEMFTNKHETAI